MLIGSSRNKMSSRTRNFAMDILLHDTLYKRLCLPADQMRDGEKKKPTLKDFIYRRKIQVERFIWSKGQGNFFCVLVPSSLSSYRKQIYETTHVHIPDGIWMSCFNKLASFTIHEDKHIHMESRLCADMSLVIILEAPAKYSWCMGHM
jgi:hypothetical protein